MSEFDADVLGDLFHSGEATDIIADEMPAIIEEDVRRACAESAVRELLRIASEEAE